MITPDSVASFLTRLKQEPTEPSGQLTLSTATPTHHTNGFSPGKKILRLCLQELNNNRFKIATSNISSCFVKETRIKVDGQIFIKDGRPNNL